MVLCSQKCRKTKAPYHGQDIKHLPDLEGSPGPDSNWVENFGAELSCLY